MQPRFNIYYKEYGSSLCELWSATDTTRAFNRVSKRIRSPRKISSPLNVSLQSFRPFCSNNILRQIRFPSFLLYSFSSPPRERKARRKFNELTQLLYKYTWRRRVLGACKDREWKKREIICYEILDRANFFSRKKNHRISHFVAVRLICPSWLTRGAVNTTISTKFRDSRDREWHSRLPNVFSISPIFQFSRMSDQKRLKISPKKGRIKIIKNRSISLPSLFLGANDPRI